MYTAEGSKPKKTTLGIEGTGELLELKHIISPSLGRFARRKFEATAEAYLRTDEPEEPLTVEVPTDKLSGIRQGVEAAINELAPDLNGDPRVIKTIAAIGRTRLLTRIQEDLQPALAVAQAG